MVKVPLRLWPLLAAATLLAAVDGCARLTYPGRRHVGEAPLAWFDATDEWTIPTLFSVAVTAAVGITCLRRRAAPLACWRLLGALFVWLAADDLFGLHEWIGALLHPWVHVGPIYSWVLVLGPLFAAVAGLCVLRIWRGLARGPRHLLALGFAMLAGALAIEAAEGPVSGVTWRLRGLPLIDYMQWLEEALELVAPVLLLAAVWSPPGEPAAAAGITTPDGPRSAAPAR